MLNKRKRIINKVKSRTKIKSMKYKINIPTTLSEAEQLDRDNNNDLWKRAIEKEAKGVRISFQLLNENEKPIIGSKVIRYHWLFTIKFDLSRNSRLVAGGHMNTEVPEDTTF